jgi:hypothetical protein
MEPQQSLKSWNAEFDSNNGIASSPSQHCGSANQNTQLHNIISHGAVNHPKICHLAASYWTVAVTYAARKCRKHHHI